jgi:hypothetical protein
LIVPGQFVGSAAGLGVLEAVFLSLFTEFERGAFCKTSAKEGKLDNIHNHSVISMQKGV